MTLTPFLTRLSGEILHLCAAECRRLCRLFHRSGFEVTVLITEFENDGDVYDEYTRSYTVDSDGPLPEDGLLKPGKRAKVIRFAGRSWKQCGRKDSQLPLAKLLPATPTSLDAGRRHSAPNILVTRPHDRTGSPGRAVSFSDPPITAVIEPPAYYFDSSDSLTSSSRPAGLPDAVMTRLPKQKANEKKQRFGSRTGCRLCPLTPITALEAIEGGLSKEGESQNIPDQIGDEIEDLEEMEGSGLHGKDTEHIPNHGLNQPSRLQPAQDNLLEGKAKESI